MKLQARVVEIDSLSITELQPQPFSARARKISQLESVVNLGYPTSYDDLQKFAQKV
jgi:hypothetical protein